MTFNRHLPRIILVHPQTRPIQHEIQALPPAIARLHSRLHELHLAIERALDVDLTRVGREALAPFVRVRPREWVQLQVRRGRLGDVG